MGNRSEAYGMESYGTDAVQTGLPDIQEQCHPWHLGHHDSTTALAALYRGVQYGEWRVRASFVNNHMSCYLVKVLFRTSCCTVLHESIGTYIWYLLTKIIVA